MLARGLHQSAAVESVVDKMNDSQNQPLIGEVGQQNFEAEVLQSLLPVLVAFGATWSRPCHVCAAVLDDIAASCAGKVKVVKVDADDNPELSMWYDIQSIPTLLYFVSGNLRARIVGTASREAIISQLQAVSHGGDANSPTPSRSQEDEHPDL